FPGRHGFEDAWRAGVPVLGTTLHAIDAGCDSGPILCQTAFARGNDADPVAARHAVFRHQTSTALQACRWLAADRVRVRADRVLLADAPPAACIAGTLHAPGLDDAEAIALATPAATGLRA